MYMNFTHHSYEYKDEKIMIYQSDIGTHDMRDLFKQYEKMFGNPKKYSILVGYN